MHVRWTRRIVQLSALLAFGWLLHQSRWVPDGQIPSPVFLRTDPLVVLTTLLAHGPIVLTYVLPGLVLLALTVVFGRFFCGWICPLGTCIDISDTLFFRHRGGQRPRYVRPPWKYYVLAAVLVAALFGTQIAWLLDPIPLLTRTSATVVYPLSLGAYNLLVIHAEPILRRLDLYLYPVVVRHFHLEVAVGLMFLAVLGMSFFARRMWCRTFCPLGALLAFVGRFGLWKRRVSEQCTSCGFCATACKMGVISADDCAKTHTPECILCYDCVACPRPGTMGIGLHAAMSGGADGATHASRRAFMAALGVGATYGVAVRLGLHRLEVHPKLIRPPGAIIRPPSGLLRRMSEQEFRDLCVRCGNCMRACPTGGLQPALGQAGWDGVFTPVLIPQIGFCEQECNVCSRVCPTGALRLHTIEEKNDIKLGLATINPDTCLPWQRGEEYRLCLVCVEHCPYQAVVAEMHEGQLRPFMRLDKCVGCGQCEHVCPVGNQESAPAITVSRRPST